MSINLYHNASVKMSALLTNMYSTSFSLGIKAFAPELQGPIYAIYGYVRLADEIVDTFHGHDKEVLLKEFRNETIRAIETGLSTNPVINAYQQVVKQYNIDWHLTDAFLSSMERDLTESSYARSAYDEYIYGSAEVVGLMCLYVFVNGDKERFKELEHSAKMLGSAFQKVNFLRDIKSDIDERGRIYLPNVHSNEGITDESKKMLENEVQKEFDQAYEGIKRLPIAAKLGVYSAFLYYLFLFKKIKSTDVGTLLRKRVRISNIKKIFLLLKSVIEVKLLKVT